jgi:hypothetical protein
MKNKKFIGFFISLSAEDRAVVDELKDKYAVNIAQAFRIFLKDMLKRVSQ